MAALAIAFNTLYLGRVVILLNIGLVLSLFCWLAGGNESRRIHPRLGPLFLLSIPIQTVHFLEEYTGGVYRTLPERFGLEALDPARFLHFNLIWIAIFITAAVGVFVRFRPALVIVWFMALIGGIGNFILHGGLTLTDGTYAPGTASALVNLVIGLGLISLLTAGEVVGGPE